MIESVPKYVQGVFPFRGEGYDKPTPLGAKTYTVPSSKHAQTVYLRAGNSCAELIYLLLQKDGKPMRYFPLGGKSDAHVPLAVVEDISPDSELTILVGAPSGVSGTVILDVGLVEI